jgi:hypothetical protein
MAFGGIAANVALGASKVNVKGTTLAARAGAADVTAADTGGLSTNSATPANYSALPADLGPGAGNWTQADVDACVVTVMNGGDALSAHAVIKTLAGADLDVVIHSTGLGAVAAQEIMVDASHSLTR